MIQARAEATLPVPPTEAFVAATDLGAADWLPAVRRLRHVGGPARGVGARYEVEVGMVGRHLRGVLVCRELEEPSRAVLCLEDGLDLTVTLEVAPVVGGCAVRLGAAYSLREGPFAPTMERASAVAARREVARAVERLAARFGRKAATGERAR